MIENEVKYFICVFLWNFIYFLNIFSINVWEQNFKLLIKMIFFCLQKVDLSCDHNYKTITKSTFGFTLSTLGLNQFGCFVCLFISNRLLSIYQIVFLMSFAFIYPTICFIPVVLSLVYLAPSLSYLCLLIILSLCL